MDLTATFNSASGAAGEAGAVQTTGPLPGGSGGGAENAAAETAAVTEATGHLENPPKLLLSDEANGALESYDPITAAESELAMLENGRATLELEHNAKPPKNVKKIVDSEIERRREARIAALTAFLEFRRSEPAAQENEFENSLEPSL